MKKRRRKRNKEEEELAAMERLNLGNDLKKGKAMSEPKEMHAGGGKKKKKLKLTSPRSGLNGSIKKPKRGTKKKKAT